MVTITKVKCDVTGCKEDADYQASGCTGWYVTKNGKFYKKFELPLKPKEIDLCKKHWKEWSKVTYKLLKMDKEITP